MKDLVGYRCNVCDYEWYVPRWLNKPMCCPNCISRDFKEVRR